MAGHYTVAQIAELKENGIPNEPEHRMRYCRMAHGLAITPTEMMTRLERYSVHSEKMCIFVDDLQIATSSLAVEEPRGGQAGFADKKRSTEEVENDTSEESSESEEESGQEDEKERD